MSVIEPQPGEVYLTHGGRYLCVETVNAQTVTYRDGEQSLEAPRWLFEAGIAKRVRRRV